MGVREAMAVGTRHLIITSFTASFTTRHENRDGSVKRNREQRRKQ